jgi:hypothetical protein
MKHKRFLFFLFLCSLLVRVLFFGFFLSKGKNYYSSDTKKYNDVAVQIVNGNGITNTNGSPHFYRLPGYSFFLAVCYKIFGIDIKKALWVQVFIAACIPLLIFFLSLVLFKHNILLAKLALLYSSIHVGFLVFSGMALTETLFIFFLLLFFISFFYAKCLWHLFLAGVCLGIASLIRPVGLGVIIVSILVLLFSYVSFFDFLRKSSVLFGGWFLVVFGWLLRNWLLTGFIFFHTLPGIHFLKHSAARVFMQLHNCSHDRALVNLSQELDVLVDKKKQTLGRDLHEIEYCLLAEHVAFTYLFENISLLPKHFFVNMFKTCFSLYAAELLCIDSGGCLPGYNKKRSWVDIIKRFLFPQLVNKWLIVFIYLEIFFFFFLLLGFFLFLVNALLTRAYVMLLCKIIPFICLFVVITLSCGFARLRLPIECFLIILSLQFWTKFLSKKESGHE